MLISLLTDGRPDFLDTKLPGRHDRHPGRYTYRIAFQDSGQNFGLAAAISTLIFIMVAASWPTLQVPRDPAPIAARSESAWPSIVENKRTRWRVARRARAS